MPFGQLPQLTELDLTACDVTDLGPIASRGTLRCLKIASCPLDATQALETLGNLEELDASYVEVDLGALPVSLTRLVLTAHPLDSLTELAYLNALESLDVGSSGLQGLAGVEALEALRDLDIRLTPVSDLGPLAGRSLERLVAIACPVAALDPLSTTSLHELNIGATRVSAIDSLPMTGLVDLGLSELVVKLGPLERASALRSLDVSRSAIDDLAGLGALDALETLDITSTGVRDLSPLSRLDRLRSLHAGYLPQDVDLSTLLGMADQRVQHDVLLRESSQ